jgi:hypothetical protein
VALIYKPSLSILASPEISTRSTIVLKKLTTTGRHVKL